MKNFTPKRLSKMMKVFFALSVIFAWSLEVKAQTYCNPSYPSGSSSWRITEVSINDFSHSPTASGHDYTSETINFQPGDELVVSVTTIGWVAVGLAVDWNKDGDFDDVDEVMTIAEYVGASPAVYNFSVTVPLTVTPDSYRLRLWNIGANAGAGNPEGSPCGTYGYGSWVDYTLSYIEDCSQTPVAGDVANMEICASRNFTLSTTNHSVPAAGQTVQWQSSVDGVVWEDMVGASTFDYTVNGGITEEMYYRLIATCTLNAESDTSETIHVTILPATECYCEVNSSGNTSYGIGNFTTTNGIENINNSSGGGSYSDYTTQKVSQLVGESVNFSITSASSTVGMAIWVDWNDNGSFNDPGEKVYSPSSYLSTGTGSISVPLNAAIGEHRMRVVANYYSTSPTACGDLGYANYGEAEDYTFEVIALEVCEGQPLAGTAEDISICPMVDFTLTTTGATSIASGLNFKWQSSLAGINNWSDLLGSEMQYNFLVQGGIDEAIDYRFVISCDASGLADTSDVIQVTLLPTNECYCDVTSTNTSYGIGNFTTTNGLQNINNTTSAGSYNDYTNLEVSQLIGESVNFSITSVSSTAGMGIWIDWNNNGSFNDPGEQVYASNSYLSQGTGIISVPLTAAPGPHRMRVVANYLSTTPTPCGALGNISYGEAEDYTFVVVAPEGCLSPVAIAKSNIENNSITISWSSLALGDQWLSYNYELRTEGTPGSGSVGLVSSGNMYEAQSVDFDNLESGTEYIFYVQTNCEGGSVSDWTNGYIFELPTYIPIVVTGFDADVVANGVGSAQSSTTNDVDGVNFALVAEDYQLNQSSNLPTKFVPNDRQIKNNEKWFVLANYSENNSLRLTAGQTGTLELEEPRAAEELYILGVSGSGASSISGTVNFSDGSTQAFSGLSYPDWYTNNASVVAAGIGRVNLTSNATEAGGGPNLYESIIIIEELNIDKTINSVSFSNGASVTGIMNIMAISIMSSEPVCIISPFDLGENMEICEGDELVLTVGTENDNEDLTVEWQDGSGDLTYNVTASGTYIVTVTYGEVCTLSDTIEVVVNPLPVVTEINATTADGFFYEFTAEGVENANTYNWDFGDGITSQQATASHYYADEGEYTVTLTVTNDCGTLTIETIIFVGDLGVSKDELSQMVKLYPNPTADEVTVEVSNQAVIEELTIVNNLGQVVYRLSPATSVVKVDVSTMSVGMYTVVIQTASTSTSKKLNIVH